MLLASSNQLKIPKVNHLNISLKCDKMLRHLRTINLLRLIER